MAFGSSRHSNILAAMPAFLVLLSLLALLPAGCSSPFSRPTKKFNELLSQYPRTEEPLQVQLLTAGSAESAARSRPGGPLTVIVHPAYALFFRDAGRSFYTEAKYDLLRYQLEHEEQFISEIAKSGNLLILVLPGNYERDSVAPHSYTRYLNSVTGGSPSVYAVYSEASSSGALPLGTVVMLHGFLRSVKPSSVLVGGGFIGRCQREFYNQVINYVGESSAYIVPEISTISPDDISDSDARTMLDSILRRDYGPVDRFIDKRNQGRARITLLPGELDRRAARASGASGETVRDEGPAPLTGPAREQGSVPEADPGREKESPVH